MCYVQIPQRANKVCQTVRAQGLDRNRIFYRMSGPQDVYPFPHLDQAAEKALGYFSKDSFHSKWYYLYFKKLATARDIAAKAMKLKYAKTVFSNYDDYLKLAKDFRHTLLVGIDCLHLLASIF